MKQQYHKPSNNAAHSYEHKRRVTIAFRDSPFFGQEGRILKETLGRHSDLNLELSSGKRIKIDAAWTDYFRVESSQNPKSIAFWLDFAQAQPIIELIEYLRGKQDIGGPTAVRRTPDQNPN